MMVTQDELLLPYPLALSPQMALQSPRILEGASKPGCNLAQVPGEEKQTVVQS